MSTQRLFLISLLLVGVMILAVWGVIEVHRRQTDTRVLHSYSSGAAVSSAVRLHRRSGLFILIDTEIASREDSRGRVVYNPLVLSEEKILLLGDGGEKENTWLAFGGLYLDYYGKFYCRRFEKCNLKRFDREVQLAYEYWKENGP
ncbi:MAG: hypothetical protein ACQEP7_02575 [bacterium]